MNSCLPTGPGSVSNGPVRCLATLAWLGPALWSCSGGDFVDASINFTKTGFNSSVQVIALATDGSGDLYVGGKFSRYAGTGSNFIAALNEDGTLDAGFVVGTGFNGEVRAIAPAVDGSGDLYVGGVFTHYDGAESSHIIALNEDGTLDPGFAVGTGFDGTVHALALATDGSDDLYVGGAFNRYNGTETSRVARLNADGTLDHGFAVGTGFSGDVFAIVTAPDGSGDVYVGGDFISYNGAVSRRIIRLNANGTLDTDFGVGVGFDGSVFAIAPATNGSRVIYVGGAFGGYDGTPAGRIVALNADGSRDAGFAIGTGFDLTVETIVPATDASTDIYVGGVFSSYNGTGSNHIIALNAHGTPNPGFDVGTGFNGDFISLTGNLPPVVHAIAPATDGSRDLYVGGSFTSYDEAGSRNIIALNVDGTLDTRFSVGTGFIKSIVLAITPLTDGSGDVYVGGGFTSYNGTESSHILALNADGTLDAGFAVGTGFNASVRAIAPAMDGSGDAYVGGSFTSYNGTASRGMVRLNADGNLDAGFAIGTGFDRSVLAIATALDNSGDIYVGGPFIYFDGAGSTGIIRLNADGKLDSSFAATGMGFDGWVWAIAPATDGSGDIYVGGGLPIAAPTSASRFQRLNADGTLDSNFTTGIGFNGLVFAIAAATGGSGSVYVGGFFSNYNGTESNCIIRLGADGTLDPGFAVGLGFDRSVLAIAPATDGSGDVYVGGSFTNYNGTPTSRILRLNADGTLDSGFATGMGFDGDVLAVATAPDGSGEVFVGGNFSSYNGSLVDGAAALNPDGSLD